MAPRIHNGKPQIVAAYDYRDEAGNLLYQAVRFEPGDDGRNKTFRPRRPSGKGGWTWGLGDVRRVLYRLPEFLTDTDRAVFIPEGEGKVEALRAIGLVATCNVGGAGKWKPNYNEALRGREVVILPDNDDPGQKHARAVAEALAGVAGSVRLLELPGLASKGDVIDWLIAGGTKEELLRLADEAPVLQPFRGRGDGIGGKRSAEPESWQPPIPLTQAPKALPFPIDVFPAGLRCVVQEGAAALPCPPDYIAVPLLALASTALGASRALAIKGSHVQRASLYAAVVGPPGSAKTPAQELVVEPAHEIEEALHADWEVK
jgi:hypothetical protein